MGALLLPPSYHLAADIDFTALATQNLKTGGDGAKTVAGKSWTLSGSANASVVDIHATGLRVQCNTNTSLYNGAAGDEIHLRIPMSTLLGMTHDPDRHRHIVVAVVEQNAANEELAEAAGVLYATSNRTNALGILRTDEGNEVPRALWIRSLGGAVDQEILADTNNTAIGFERIGHQANLLMGEVYEGVIPPPSWMEPTLGSGQATVSLAASATPIFDANDVLMLAAWSNTTNGTFQATFKRLQVWRCVVPGRP